MVRGFTLLETMMAMVIMLAGLMIAVPGMSKTYREYLVRSEAVRIASEIRSARILAVTRNTSYRVEIDATVRAIRLSALNPDSGNFDLARTVNLGPGAASVTVSPPSPVLFGSSGIASVGSTITVRGPRGDQYRLQVLPPGRVELLR